MMLSGSSTLPFPGPFRAFWTQLSRCCPSFMEDQAMHVVSQIGEGDLGLGALDADGADEQAHLVFLPGENVFDARAHL